MPTPSITDWISAIATCLAAIGTISVAALAVWGPAIVRRCFGPKLRIRDHRMRGTATPIQRNGTVVGTGWFYLLKVVNERPYSPADRVEVWLKRLQRRTPDGGFEDLELSTPLPFHWSPSELRLSQPTVTDEQVFDFFAVICIDQKPPMASCRLRARTHNFQGDLSSGGCLRYWLVVVAGNAYPQPAQAFEVAWTGGWSKDGDEMRRFMTVKEVPAG